MRSGAGSSSEQRGVLAVAIGPLDLEADRPLAAALLGHLADAGCALSSFGPCMKRIHWGWISRLRPSKRASSLYQVPSRGAGVASGEQPEQQHHRADAERHGPRRCAERHRSPLRCASVWAVSARGARGALEGRRCASGRLGLDHGQLGEGRAGQHGGVIAAEQVVDQRGVDGAEVGGDLRGCRWRRAGRGAASRRARRRRPRRPAATARRPRRGRCRPRGRSRSAPRGGRTPSRPA